MIRLGPFELQKTIGAGGMGEIWRAVHLSNGIPVAIKVLQNQPDQPVDEFRESFLHEVRLVAGLRHRNVVMALDAGTVSEAADQASGGRLKAGSPFLAMELAGGGSLAGKRIEAWSDCRHVLVQLLDGLAHAHAHGIVHRDVKPGNVLLASERSEIAAAPKDLASARIVVTDFGIGGSRELRAVPDVYETGAPVGTPNYMAPEQIRAQWRDHGPWTDLYATGCMAWQFLTGSTPFRDPNPVRTLAGHLQEPPPPFLPQYDVPADLEGWLRQLLEKDPGDRFAFAADAKRALLELGEPVSGSGRGARGAVPIGDLPTVLHTGKNREEHTVPPVATGGARTSWRPGSTRADEPGRDFRLEGAGLGLYGLRAIPLVARKAERERLWAALGEVQTTRSARMVVLRGPSGTGKSRLVEWLARAAHEEGAGVTLKSVHGPTSLADPASQLAEAALRCDGLEQGPALDRVSAFLGEAGGRGVADVLAQLAAPGAFAERPPLTRRESHAATEVLLRRVAGPRVVVVWLEDAHQSTEALFLARRLVESPEPLPVLLLVTVQDEELAERPDETAFVQSVVVGGATELVVGLLGAEEHHELVQVLLGLEGALAQRIEERTHGNPLFAVQLVGHLVARGLLVPGERGFKLKPGTAFDIPDDLLAVWEEHAERLLAAWGDHEARALELAAVFGLELRQSDFQELCAIGGLAPNPEVVTEAMRRRLIRPLGGRVQRWAFVHGMLREVLLRRVRRRGHWQQANRVCAEHLGSAPRPDPERLSRHLLDAGDLLGALAPLHTAVTERFARGDFRSGALVAEAERAAKDVGLPESDPRWGDVWLDQAWLFLGRGDLPEAERWAVRVERAARRHAWSEVLPRALRLAAQVERKLGHLDEAITLTREAEESFVARGDQVRAAVCRTQMGDLLMRSSVPKAAEAYKAALAMTSDPQHQINAWKGLADCAQRQNDLSSAKMCLERVRDTATRAGQRSSLAYATNVLGEIARKSGDLAGAEALYREAAARYQALDDASAVYPLLNVGLLQVLRGAWTEAAATLGPVLAREERGGVQTVPACFARAVLLPCAAGEGAWDKVTEHLSWLEAFLGEKKILDADLGRMAALAGSLTATAGREVLAVRCWTLARDQWVGLGDRDGTATADQALRALAWR